MTVHPWNQPVWNYLTAARTRSAHAWLFAGPRGLGKSECAMAFARHLIAAAGETRNEQLFDAGTHPDVHVIVREVDAEDSDALAHRYARRHIDERPKGSKPKTVITVGQVRSLIQGLSTRPHSAAHKVAILLDAHNMNVNAANALLKLLEEPPEDTVLVCVTDQMHRLPATVRSRCARVTFVTPVREVARSWLESRIQSDQVNAALDLAGGAPLEALELIEGDGVENRKKWLKALEALYSGRADAAATAELGKQIGLRDALALSQKTLVDLVRCRMTPEADRLFNADQKQWLQKRAERLQLHRTFDLIDLIGRLRQDVDGPLDASLLLEDTLIQMRNVVGGNA